MGKFDTQYSPVWETKYDWLQKVPDDKFQAKCKICKTTFKINGAGVGQVKIHSETKKHISAAMVHSGNTAQCTFQVGESGMVQIQRGSFILTQGEKVVQAEILWALKCVQSNFSFNSNIDNNNLFAKMFPDSAIAASYKMSATKVKYTIQFGLAVFVKDELKQDIKNTPFAFKFDETTTSQVKKQYDGYVQYLSKKGEKIVNRYCGSLFLGHCAATKLFDCFIDFGRKKMDWNIKYLLHLGMDGPNVNLAFQNLVKQELLKDNKVLLDVGTCSLHIIHNGFQKALKKLDFDYDGFPHDIWFFFKHSTGRREDYKLMSLITDCETNNILRHVNSRWLSLKRVYIRILEQWENLKEYFLKFLPKEKNFSKEIGPTSRYKKIVNVLSNKDTHLYINFTIHLAEILENFLIPFQSTEPKIQQIFITFGDIFFDLMSQFINMDQLTKNGKRKNAHELGILNFKETSSILKSIHAIEYGTKTKHLIAQSEGTRNVDAVKTQFKLAYIELVTYFQKKLPHDSKLLKDVQYFSPEKKLDNNAVNAVGRTACLLSKVVQNTSFTNLSVEQYADVVKTQFKHFQTEDIDFNGSIDTFWVHVGKIKNHLDAYKFKELSELALAVLCISHSNVVPEQGFSMNKYILQHKETLDEGTIEAIRLVKDSIQTYGEIGNFPINAKLFECVSNSYQRYQEFMENEKKEADDRANEIRKRTAQAEHEEASKSKKKKSDEKIAAIDEKIRVKIVQMKTAEEMLTEGNALLEKTINSSKCIKKNDIISAQSKISTGLEKTKSIQSEIDALNLKKKQILNTLQ